MGWVVYLVLGWFMLSMSILVIWAICLWPQSRPGLEVFQDKLLRQICEDLHAQGLRLEPHEVRLEVDERSVQIVISLTEGDTLELPLQLQPVPGQPGVTAWTVRGS